MQLVLKAALALAMVISATVTVPRAHALHSTKIRIDNSPNPTGYPTGTNTTGTFMIDLAVEGEAGPWITVAYSTISSVSGTIDFCAPYDEDKITAVRFRISDGGNDALWIDQWQTFDYDATANCTGSYTSGQTHGVDSQLGYCMSQDASWYRGNDPIVCGLDGVDDWTNGWDWGPSKSMLMWYY